MHVICGGGYLHLKLHLKLLVLSRLSVGALLRLPGPRGNKHLLLYAMYLGRLVHTCAEDDERFRYLDKGGPIGRALGPHALQQRPQRVWALGWARQPLSATDSFSDGLCGGEKDACISNEEEHACMTYEVEAILLKVYKRKRSSCMHPPPQMTYLWRR
jgi:hypothetical protein